MPVPTVRLRNHRDARVKGGHPWVFSNEIADDVATLPAGGVVDVVDPKGAFVGRGTANPRSLIAVRLWSRSREDLDGPDWFAARLTAAVARRAAALPGRTAYRLVHGEADGVPGLVIDRYHDVVVVQIGALGVELRKDALHQALRDVLSPRAIVLRSEGPARGLEGLDDERRVWSGDLTGPVEIDENGVRFRVDVLDGQKTGHFFDQSENRRFMGERCAGATVLDVYANSGGWALYAMRGGARSATAVDRSAGCVDAIRANAGLNGVAVEAVQDDGQAYLQRLVDAGARFDAVVLDPPAFAKNRKAAGAALRGYRKINALGAALVRPGGWLFTSSCSWHVDEERFVDAVASGARDAGKQLRIVRRGEQAPDHPVLPEVPETRYLKSLAALVEDR
ncbi:MAG: class I SAM-dependent rRNA methyltransferase [Myxococcota bacterium]